MTEPDERPDAIPEAALDAGEQAVHGCRHYALGHPSRRALYVDARDEAYDVITAALPFLRAEHPEAGSEAERLREVMRHLVESPHAPHYGSVHCVCGPQATPANDCPVHWAIAVIEQLQDEARAAHPEAETRFGAAPDRPAGTTSSTPPTEET
jgi:hypothetical protein